MLRFHKSKWLPVLRMRHFQTVLSTNSSMWAGEYDVFKSASMVIHNINFWVTNRIKNPESDYLYVSSMDMRQYHRFSKSDIATFTSIIRPSSLSSGRCTVELVIIIICLLSDIISGNTLHGRELRYSSQPCQTAF